MQIQAPTKCPSCSSELVWVKDQLYCNNTDCPAKSNKQIEHFAKSLKIKGLGPATIDKLQLSSIIDIYGLTDTYIVEKLNSQVTASKLLVEINQSTKSNLNMLLPAFGIPLIGNSVTSKLATVVTNIDEINKETCIKAGVGPKATENLINWLNKNLAQYKKLPFDFKFSSPVKSLNNEVVCISGKLKSCATKAIATKYLEEAGYTVVDTITKKVTILINESGEETAKVIKARDSGVLIITNLTKFLMEKNK